MFRLLAILRIRIDDRIPLLLCPRKARVRASNCLDGPRRIGNSPPGRVNDLPETSFLQDSGDCDREWASRRMALATWTCNAQMEDVGDAESPSGSTGFRRLIADLELRSGPERYR